MTVSIAKNVAAHYAGLFVLGLSNLLLVPILLHYLGTEGYGIFNLCIATVAVLQFLEMGIANAGVKYVAEWKALNETITLRQFYSSGLILFLLIGICTAVAVFFLADPIARLSHVTGANLDNAVFALRIAGLGLVFLFPSILIRTFLEGFQRYDLSNAAQAFQSGIALLLIVGGIWKGSPLGVIVSLVTLSFLLELSLLLLFKRKVLKDISFQFPSAGLHIFRKVQHLSFWNFVWNLASKVSWDLDVFVISFFQSARSVTPFVLGRKLPNLVSVAASRWVQVLHPLSSELNAGGKQDELRHLFLRGTTICLSFVIPAAIWLIFFSTPTLKLWLHDFPSSTVQVQRLFAWAILVDLLHSVSAILLAGKGMLKKVSLYFLLEAVMNLLLSVWWVGPYGVIGVAAATAFSTTFVVFVFQIPYACSVFGITFAEFVQKLIKPHVLPGILCALIFLAIIRFVSVINLGIWLGTSIAAAVAYFAVLWFMSFNQAERQTLRHFFKASNPAV